MTRILADLSDDDIEWLDHMASEQGKSRAQVMRDAVASHRSNMGGEGGDGWVSRGAGLWKGRSDIGDGVELQRALRSDSAPGRER